LRRVEIREEGEKNKEKEKCKGIIVIAASEAVLVYLVKWFYQTFVRKQLSLTKRAVHKAIF
jgi:hypothetical protein